MILLASNQKNGFLRTGGALVLMLALLGLFVLTPAPATAQGGSGVVRVVPSGGSTAADCGSEAAPCASIQLAVSGAQSGDQIWLAGGVHTGTGGAVVALTDTKSLTIVGGYNAANWQLDAAANPTYIDGEGARRGVLVVDTFTAERFENVVIRNGLANTRYGNWGAMGGGMLCPSNASVQLQNVTFSNNRVQGPDTTTVGGGGAAFLWGGPGGACPVTMENVVFEGNQAVGGNGSPRGGQAHGGGMYATYSNVTGTNVTFSNNSVQAGSGGVGYQSETWNRADALGGGASFQNNTVTFTGLTATGNHTTGGAGSQYGGFSNGGGLFFELATATVVSATLQDNTVTGGAGTSVEGGVGGGGALMSQGTALTLNRVTMVDNAAYGGSGADGGDAGGGGMYLSRATTSCASQVSASNIIMAGNKAEAGAGANRWGGGGAIFNQNVNLTLTHATIAGNSVLSTMRAPAIVALNYLGSSRVTARYSTIADHVGPGGSAAEAAIFAQNSGTSVSLDYTLFHGNTVNSQTADGASLSNSHAVSGEPDPLFLSPGSPDYDYHIAGNSPAREAATGSSTTTDVDGQARPFGNVADIGADEFHASLTNSTKSASPSSIDAEEGGPGHTVVYTVVLRNSGTEAIDAELTDELPTPPSPLQLSLLSGSCTSGSCNFNTSSDTVTWSGSVPALGQVTIAYNVNVTVPVDYEGNTSVLNVAGLSYSDGQGGSYNDSLTGSLMINPYTVHLPIVIR